MRRACHKAALTDPLPCIFKPSLSHTYSAFACARPPATVLAPAPPPPLKSFKLGKVVVGTINIDNVSAALTCNEDCLFNGEAVCLFVLGILYVLKTSLRVLEFVFGGSCPYRISFAD